MTHPQKRGIDLCKALGVDLTDGAAVVVGINWPAVA